jgi:arsenate reductase
MLNVFVICTGNSCRSLLGEALFNHLGEGRIKAFSAGSHPLGRLNKGAVATLKRHGLSVEGYKSQSWDEFEHQPMDIVITVCDNAAGETCPVYLNTAAKVHWGLVDPGHIKGTDEEIITAFEKTYGILENRINKMLSLPLETMTAEGVAVKLNAMVDED